VICRRCPVILECAADALDNHVEFGVWGGMTERQRRALLKQHPEVVSWADFFAAQRKHRSAGWHALRRVGGGRSRSRSASMTLDVYADLFESDLDDVAVTVSKMCPRWADSQ
jgi:WhiB family redox-sensing transcriptional regulator